MGTGWMIYRGFDVIITENKNIIARCKKDGISWMELRRFPSTIGAAEGVVLRKLGINDQFMYNYPSKKQKWIIVFDASVSNYYLERLKKIHPESRLILWIWNPIKYLTFDLKKVPSRYEIWSYSERDCKENGLKYNTQFMFYDYGKVDSLEKNIENDVFYVGKDKGRGRNLLILKSEMEKKGLAVEMHLVANTNHGINSSKKYYSSPMPYSEVIEHIRKSKSILDYYEDPYMGISLRPLEALYFQKKLITNNKNIYNYDFYRPENIFVLGDQSLNMLPEFLNSKFYDTRGLRENYSFTSWLKRFKRLN